MVPASTVKTAENLRAHTILIVDDEPLNVEAFEFNFAREFTVRSATDAADARQQIAAGNIAVVIADHKMPGESGLDLLTWVARAHPNTVRILLTAYSEVDLLQDALNRGVLFRFAKKPWRHRELKHDLVLAIRERMALLGREAAARTNTVDAIVEGMNLMARHVADDVSPLFDRIQHVVDRAQAGTRGAEETIEEISSILEDIQGHLRPLSMASAARGEVVPPLDLGALGVALVEAVRPGAAAYGVELHHDARQVWADLPVASTALETTLRALLEGWVPRIVAGRGHSLLVSVATEDEGSVRLEVCEVASQEPGVNGVPFAEVDEQVTRQLRVLVEAMRGRLEMSVGEDHRSTVTVILPASIGPDLPPL